MYRIFSIIFGLMIVSNYLAAQYSLEIEITGLKNNEGKIMLQVFDEKQKVLTQEMSAIKEKKCLFSFKNLNPGKYAVRYFHDENLNGTSCRIDRRIILSNRRYV